MNQIPWWPLLSIAEDGGSFFFSRQRRSTHGKECLRLIRSRNARVSEKPASLVAVVSFAIVPQRKERQSGCMFSRSGPRFIFLVVIRGSSFVDHLSCFSVCDPLTRSTSTPQRSSFRLMGAKVSVSLTMSRACGRLFFLFF